MHSARLLVPTALLGLFVCAVACNTNKDDETQGQTSARQVGNGNGNGPPGNNTTVKIQEAGSEDEIPDTDAHVGCSLEIEFRGFDQGNLNATWQLLAWPPSGDMTVIKSGTTFIGEDPPEQGANDLDAVQPVTFTDADLAGLTKTNQGYHLKLEVHADGSQGADTKFKVFWVDGCGGTSSSSGGSSGGSSSGGSSGGSSSGGSSSGGSSGGSSSGGSSGGSSSGATW